MIARDFGLALIVVAHSKGLVLCYDGPDFLREVIRDDYVVGGEFTLENVDHAPLADGVYVGELLLVDDGPGDWSGSREVALQMRNARPATLEEWTAHLNGEWAWEPFVREPRPNRELPRSTPRQRCTGCGEYADELRPDRCAGHNDAGHNDIDVDENGMAIPRTSTTPEKDAVDFFERRAPLGDDE